MLEVESSVGASLRRALWGEDARALKSTVMDLMFCHSGHVVLIITNLSKRSQHLPFMHIFFGPTPHRSSMTGASPLKSEVA